MIENKQASGYKYKPVSERLFESLANNEVYCPKPEKLNDPFDCRIDLRGCFSRAAKLATDRRREWAESVGTTAHGAEFLTTCENRLANLGVFSMAQDHQDTLLWAHYGDEHKGVCLLYEFTDKLVQGGTEGILGTDKVHYEPDRLARWIATDAPMEMRDFLAELLKMYTMSKAPEWAYEKEFRLLRQEPGVVKLPHGALKQVIYGMRITPENQAAVHDLAIKAGCNVFGKIERKPDTDYGIHAIEI